MRKLTLFTLLGLALLVASGCAKRQYVTQPEDESSNPPVAEAEQLQPIPEAPPVMMPADKDRKIRDIEMIEVEEPTPPPTPPISEPPAPAPTDDKDVWEGAITHSPMAGDTPPPPPPPPVMEEPQQIKGWRVQIGAMSAEENAHRLASEARNILGERVYVDYVDTPPNWKVRVGDCKTRAEADALKQRVQKNGYSGAWVVECMINNP
ncbi:MAG: SPOR domain-containing protein [Gemmatimonadetes bacterium]|nr:MAG: SPOR domain-containing protein [Gemmatimonadota bacterium]